MIRMEDEFICATDIKNWIYCPLIVYFRKILRLKPKVYSQQIYGREKHGDVLKKIARRVGIALNDRRIRIARKILEKDIVLSEEKLRGIVDLIVETESGELIPVEIKMMNSRHGKPWSDHVYQLAFYAILIEKYYSKLVKRGFIYYVNEEKLIEVLLTFEEKKYVMQIVNNIRRMLETECIPRLRINRKRCTGGCGYEWICKKINII